MRILSGHTLLLGVILVSSVLLMGASAPLTQVSLHHATIGFAINSVARVNNAVKLGVNTAIEYGTAFTPSSAVGAAMLTKGMHEIDASLASNLFYYECHRTHTVAPPPNGGTNTYCATDVNPAINSEAALLATIDTILKADAANSLIVGYWVLDDWALWDSGSAKIVLQDIHTHIQMYTPAYPAICGFGAAVDLPNVIDWNPLIAQNYSNQGCDMVGVYSYVNSYPSYTSGSQFDFSMAAELSAVLSSLRQQGWNVNNTPLLGIDQAFAGPFGGTRYEPGITSTQMRTQAKAFCSAGASSIGWYGWYDSGFSSQTLQPTTSAVIQQGIRNSISACQSMWSTS